ncbi:MAG: TIGR03915 family putative DNA repair protein [Eubacteriales bacterium]|nr:TIGR03915 family putative DNA repair protein [Eubacteriales bacterium]
MEYVYDGTFDGLLCCLYAHVYEEAAQAILPEADAGQLGLAPRRKVTTRSREADRVADAIEKKISRNCLRRCYRAFLSGEPGVETDILAYVFYGFSKGKDVDLLHGDPIVRRIDVLNHKVGRETERMLGMIRFGLIRDPEGQPILYAHIAPDCDLLQLVMPHFLNRYRREPFVIHDIKREKAAFSTDGRWVMQTLSRDFSPEYTPDEEACRALWRRYFTNAAIQERINLRCQKNFMPRRYWQHLVENPEEKRAPI